jgi:hypothetical protein
LIKATQHAEALLNALGRARLKRHLFDMVRSVDGLLRVWETRKVEREDPFTGEVLEVDEVAEIPIGKVQGYAVLGTSFHPTSALRRELQPLDALNRGGEELAQHWVLENGYDHKNELRLVRYSIARARDVRRRCFGYIADTRAFFSPANFEVLARYGNDSRRSHPLFAEYASGIFRIGERRTSAVRVRPDFGIMERLPPWPASLE